MIFIKNYWFIIALFLLIILSFFEIRYLEFLSNDTLKWSGIFLIFFFQGLGLDFNKLINSYKPIRLHIFVLTWNFIFFPLLVLLLFIPFIDISYRLSFICLSIAPCTVAMSVSFTYLSGGRTESSLFSTCCSNFLGAIYIPILIFLLFKSGTNLSIFSTILKVLFYIIFPVTFGVLFRKYFLHSLGFLISKRSFLIEILLLIIIFQSFKILFNRNLNTPFFLNDGIEIFSYTFIIFILVNVLVWVSSSLIKLDRESKISAFFSASHKSIVSGIPIIIISTSSFDLLNNDTIILLPLIFYHLLQMLFGAFLVNYFKSI